jgi:hypothetical protein
MGWEHYDLNFVKSAIRYLSVYGEVVSTHGAYPSNGSSNRMLQYLIRLQVQR